ncbi:phenylpyruvate tautomerase PptA (4-oxalocrotonate tautomerase family) [Leeuwenhoekiella aestuarii]|uniref:Phenylpyruvate tautomerase PptA (4-oxalocrotonate tautomerase family) n=1 Tax=Leeuwenhoekiella aestuarii TaxID=2249426 RepID=A0A4Q0NN91_9FLAO|nr:tautomerase family protein [Leeuwenhoekiella aestuarii]RXG11401.1 phenylpyruvate tautomerase PptA (4-oxalocrotonate tautomerase family) [Leeuwenhoekiella aestuarii]RXG12138.1 phenylpyruvate tautomerase PptA (4-oxalocrotonate tautomerase family) [Leeuwenhoekiella aestuarii]
MPLIYFNCPEGTFNQQAKTKMANELTKIALDIEKLPKTDFVKSTCWIYFNDYSKENVYHGGSNAGTSVISLEVNAFKGGLDQTQKKDFIIQFTNCIHKYAGLDTNEVSPVYIIFRDVETYNWGVFGNTIQLEDLKNAPVNAKPV